LLAAKAEPAVRIQRAAASPAAARAGLGRVRVDCRVASLLGLAVVRSFVRLCRSRLFIVLVLSLSGTGWRFHELLNLSLYTTAVQCEPTTILRTSVSHFAAWRWGAFAISLGAIPRRFPGFQFLAPTHQLPCDRRSARGALYETPPASNGAPPSVGSRAAPRPGIGSPRLSRASPGPLFGSQFCPINFWTEADEFPEGAKKMVGA